MHYVEWAEFGVLYEKLVTLAAIGVGLGGMSFICVLVYATVFDSMRGRILKLEKIIEDNNLKMKEK